MKLPPMDLQLQTMNMSLYAAIMYCGLILKSNITTFIGHKNYIHTHIHTRLYSARNPENESEVLYIVFVYSFSLHFLFFWGGGCVLD